MVKRTSSLASNQKFRVRFLVGLLTRQPKPTWLDAERHRSCKAAHAGANPVVGSCDYITNNMTRGCAGKHGSLRNCRTRFDSWASYSALYQSHVCSRSVPDSTRLCEGRRSGSIPGESTCCERLTVSQTGADQCDTTTDTTTAFEPMSKRRRGFPSETQVKRGVRVVHGDKQLEEKLGRNDPCPCGSRLRFKKCCMRLGHS